MDCHWLNKNGNKNLIVFFNGWGMDEKIVSHLNCTNYGQGELWSATVFMICLKILINI